MAVTGSDDLIPVVPRGTIVRRDAVRGVGVCCGYGTFQQIEDGVDFDRLVTGQLVGGDDRVHQAADAELRAVHGAARGIKGNVNDIHLARGPRPERRR